MNSPGSLYVRLVKGSLGLMVQLITALTVKLLAATDELRSYPTADTEGVAENAMELADTLRCCLDEMWNMVGAGAKATAAPGSKATAATPAKGKKKTAAPSAALMVTTNHQVSA